MPKKRFHRLPRVLSPAAFITLLGALGGSPCGGGRHPSHWRFPLPDGRFKEVPISRYRIFHADYYYRVVLRELGFSKTQVLAALNSETVGQLLESEEQSAGSQDLDPENPE